MLKPSAKSFLYAAFLASLWAPASHAFSISPIRCAQDNLPQWKADLDPKRYPEESTPSEGTARGRQAWWKKCDPESYRRINLGSDKFGIKAEFDPTANHNNGMMTRWYPTFGVLTGFDEKTKELIFSRPGNYTAPTSEPKSVDDPACKLPAQYQFVGMCTSGCVTPEQEVSAPEGDLPIVALEQLENPSVLVPVIGKYGLENYEPLKVSRFIKDNIDSEQKIIVVSTRHGRRLRLSVNHPMMIGDYSLRRADKLNAGDTLVRADGETDEIIDVHTEPYFGRLHNLTVDTASMEKSLYVVGGYISGDKKYQDTQISDLNRTVLRTLVN